MYKFIDTTEVSESVVLPSEALQINGEYIENLIDGYRTLGVSGREALSPELSYYETGVRDGSVLQSKRYPARIIIVSYQLVAESNEAFREAYNKLGKILNVENAELIFNDEPDKYYVGTPSVIGEVEPGRNAVVGEIEILCTDPFKYSVLEYEATASLDANSVLIDYNGTYKSYPTLEADFCNEGEDGENETTLSGNGDCGYVAFFNENEKIIQLGDPDEKDATTAYARSQTLINQLFDASGCWGTTAKRLWAVNGGTVIPSNTQQIGSVAMGVASYAVPANPASTSATILNATAAESQPIFYYTLTAKTSKRTANSVYVNVAITTSLGRDSSYFGYGYGLRGWLYIGGSWRSITLKDGSSYWRGRTGHTVNYGITITGLSATTSAITGIKFRAERTDPYGQYAGRLGETNCSNIPISQYVDDVPETYYLTASSYGSASGAWHGASITRQIGADASGEVGAKDFTLTYKQKMCIGNTSNASQQLGAFQMQLSDSTGASVVGVRIHKNLTNNKASMLFYINGAKVYGTTIDLSYANKYFGANSQAVQTTTITKTGSKVVFNCGGVQQVFTNSAITDVKVTKVTFMFEQYSTNAALAYNGLYWAKFVKNNCETMKDIPNKFSANDVVEANCKNGEVRLNNVLTPSLGALGNDWEEFYLMPGLNQIGFSYSDWVASGYAPTIKVRYREVFL